VDLKGQLDEFSLKEMLIFIGKGERTGSLKIETNGNEGGVYFDKGNINFAFTNENRIPIGIRLVDAELITKEQLEESLKIQESKQDIKLGQILKERDFITEDLLEFFVQDQIFDTLFEMCSWGNGIFVFDLKDKPEEEIGVNLSIDLVMGQINKRLKEWNELKSKLPASTSYLVLSKTPSNYKEEIKVKPEEWRILFFLKEKKTVDKIRSKYHLTVTSLYNIISNMLDKGLIEPAGFEEKTEGTKENEEQDKELSGTQEETEEEEIPADTNNNTPVEILSYFKKLKNQF
jgi:hypothetical protein